MRRGSAMSSDVLAFAMAGAALALLTHIAVDVVAIRAHLEQRDKGKP